MHNHQVRLPRSWLSVEQIRAARMMADLDQAGAAEACGIPIGGWRSMERKRGRYRLQPKQMAKIISGFRERGIVFTRDGVGYAEGHGPGDYSPWDRRAA